MKRTLSAMSKVGMVLLLLLVTQVNVVMADSEAAKALITQLKDANFGVSMRAQNDLVKLQDMAVPALNELLVRDYDAWNRVKAVNVLGRIGTEDAVEAMVKGLSDRDPIVRDAVVKAIEKLNEAGRAAAKPLLVELAVKDEYTTRTLAIQSLQSINVGNAEIAEALLVYVDTGGKTWDLALGEIARLGAEAGTVVPQLLAMVTGSQPTDLRLLEVITTVGGEAGRQAIPKLYSLLLTNDWDLRQEAIWGMRKLKMSGQEMVNPVLSLLESVVATDVKLATEILAQQAITQPVAANLLFDLIEDENNSKEVRQLAYDALKPVAAKMEYHIDRGLVAVNTDAGVFLSWRLLGTEVADIGFNVYRDGVKVTSVPITNSTNYLDASGNLEATYAVRAVEDGKEGKPSSSVSVMGQNYLSIPLNIPDGGITPDRVSYTYHANDASAADLNGDGQYEIVLKWDPTNAKDNAHSGYTGNVYFDAYKLDGTHMWRIDMGRNIRAGAHYTQFMVYDLDGDGRAEVVMKTADGTVDGLGNVIGDPNADYRASNGYVLAGPEYLTVFDGLTGEALQTIDYKPARGNVSSWGDGYGNRVDRFLAGVAYLDGVNPSVIMVRGYYTRTVLVAYNWRDGQLEEVWTFDSATDPALRSWEGQGNHQLSIADVDSDGKDEIIFGAMTIDHDGAPLYNTRLGHGDALHVTDHDPDRVGLEVFAVHESSSSYAGINLRDARTGEIIWGIPTNYDVGRGAAANIDPNYRGSETWASRTKLMDVDGTDISNTIPSINFFIWWDGDLLREIQSGSGITKYDWENDRIVTLLNPPDAVGNNGTKNTPSLVADLFGDWREELVVRTEKNDELRVYTTTDLTEHRLYTLMHDRQYRLAVAWQNVAYNQPPHPSFYVGPDMEPQVFNQGLIWEILDRYAEELDN